MVIERIWRYAAVLVLLTGLAACGGGGGTTGETPVGGTGGGTIDLTKGGVFTGFNGDLAWEAKSGGIDNEGIGDGADGGGGYGVGGALGQFRGALVKAYLQDGTLLGEALTDDIAGMVTVRPPDGYQGPMLLEIHGRDGATYFEEGKNAYVPYGPGRVLRSLISKIERNVGITPFSEAGYQLALVCQSGQSLRACGNDAGPGLAPNIPNAGSIEAANGAVREVVNQQFPSSLHVDDVTRLPFIVNDNTPAGTIATDQRGRYGLVNVAFSKQAAMYNTALEAPTLEAVDGFARDLSDGQFDGLQNGQAVGTAGQRTYDPHTYGTELSSALAQQTNRYGNSAALASLPSVVAFGNVRYDDYYFDARIQPGGDAATVAMATESDSNERTPGQVTTYVQPENDRRGFMVYGNLGSGGLFIKTDSADSTSGTLVLGDNVHGELGNGATGGTPDVQAITLPGVLTHAAGGFGHTVLRLADGSVWVSGDNRYGQLGQGRLPPDLGASTQVLRVPLPAGAVAVGATYAASFALLDTGFVYAWGSSIGFGTLGNGQGDSIQASPQPVLAADGNPLSDIVQISARDNDVIALRADGTVWTWGSFTQQATGQAPFGVKPGEVRATQVQGLPSDGTVRKVLTEEGLFVAMIHGGDNHGATYSWGVYFDITANDYLYDLQPVRVLNLPPLRDIMPGGFLGYGQQPSARTTGMGIDYQGRLWKIRGVVAERYEVDNPTAQRRPQGQAPRKDCASCHTVRGDSDPVPPPADAPLCVLPAFKLDASGQPLLVNSQSDCASCHNGSALSDGTILPPLTCRTPDLPPPPAPTLPTPKTGQCELPVGHPAAPERVFCASCHNQVVTAPLTCSPDTTPLPPPSATTVTITAAEDDVGSVQGALTSGSVTDDTQALLRGTTSAALIAGETVRVLRDGVDIGAAVPSGATAWSFQLPATGDGTYRYTARVLNAGGASGQASTAFDLTVATSGPPKVANIVRLDDNLAPQIGAVGQGGSTNDASPAIVGSVNPVLTSGESIRLWRNDTLIATIAPSDTSWTFTDGGLDAVTGGEGDLTYRAQVISAAGVAGAFGSDFTVRFDNRAPAVPTVSASANFPVSAVGVLQPLLSGSLVSGRGTMDATPEVSAVFQSSRGDERIQFTMSTSAGGQTFDPVNSGDIGSGQRRASLPIDTGLNLNGATAGVTTHRRTFFARSVDAAGNQSALSAGFQLDFGFFACQPLITRPGYTSHNTRSTNCLECHSSTGPSGSQRLNVDAYSCTQGSADDVLPPR